MMRKPVKTPYTTKNKRRIQFAIRKVLPDGTVQLAPVKTTTKKGSILKLDAANAGPFGKSVVANQHGVPTRMGRTELGKRIAAELKRIHPSLRKDQVASQVRRMLNKSILE